MTIVPNVIAAAQASEKKYYPNGPFVSVSLAQYGDESAWGTVMSGTNNPFGIKATAAQIAAGKAKRVMTHETLANGQYVKIPQWFANYDSIDEAFDAHASLLCTAHYRACQDAATPEEYCQALQACGYATGIPGHPYGEVLIDIINSMNLKQYDNK